MTWQETYNRYEDSELMKEFGLWARTKGIVVNMRHESCNIKDVWGYLICFAETKGFLEIKSRMVRGIRYTNGYFYNKKEWYSDNFDNPEQAMLWCANKFFEVANGKI